jgi:hypothetical protein
MVPISVRIMTGCTGVRNAARTFSLGQHKVEKKPDAGKQMDENKKFRKNKKHDEERREKEGMRLGKKRKNIPDLSLWS